MLGRIDPSCKEATVVGAGMAGMLLARKLRRNGFRVRLIEKATRGGGLIRTEIGEYGLSESAAHSLLASPPVAALCRDLGVDMLELRPDSKARYILREGRMRRFPLTPREAMQTAAKVFFSKSRRDASLRAEDGTLEQWGLRHLGEPALRYLLSPFLIGIYGARPGEIDQECAFPALSVPAGDTLFSTVRRLRAERRRQGQERPRMVTPRAGMGELATRLEQSLRKELGADFEQDRELTVLPEGPNVVLAVPAYVASGLLSAQDEASSRALSRIRYAPMVSVTAIVRTEDLRKDPRGVGVLMPESERRRCLGILFNSSSFEGRVREMGNFSSFTLMFGGTLRPEVLERSDTEILEDAAQELNSLFGLKAPPVFARIHRWPRAIPIYSPEISKVWEICRQSWCATPGRVLFGNYTGQVSLRGMIECVDRIQF